MRQVFLLTLSFLLGTFGIANAQLFVNDGADIVVEPGATLVIEGGLENKNGGTINNDGTIEVEGDFLNTATFDGSDPNKVIFSGSENALVTSNGAIFDSVEIAKSATKVIELQDDMTVGGAITFVNNDNYVDLGASADLVMQDGASFVNADNNNFVITGGTGYLRTEGVGTSETVEFPVGYDAATYNPVELMTTGSHTSDDFEVRVLEGANAEGLTGDPITSNVVNATWEINEGVAGGSDVDLTLQWNASDELTGFDRGFSAVSRYDGAAWDALYEDFGMADGAGPYTQTRFSTAAFSPFIVAGGEGAGQFSNALQLELKAFLAGPYLSGSMRDILRDSAVIPNVEPYTGGGYAFQGFGGNEEAGPNAFDDLGLNSVVDWVVVELRDVSDSSTVVASRAALIQSDGDIVNEDGSSPLKIYGAPNGDYVVAVDHRNHLGIRQPVANALTLSSTSSTAYNFTTGAAQAYTDPAITSNGPMRSLGGGLWGMHGGDANDNDAVSYNGSFNDRFSILTALTFNPNGLLSDVYRDEDVNMDARVLYNGSNNDRFAVLTQLMFNPNGLYQRHD